MLPRPLDVDGPFGLFAVDLIELELPDLPEPRRVAVVEFVCRRATQLPAPLRLGVAAVATAAGAGQRLIGTRETTTFLQTTRLPFVGELARLVRSLGVAFVWESWPDTSPTGRPT